MILVLALQAIGPPDQAPVARTPRAAPRRACPAQPEAGDDVVVCGRVDQEQFRVRPMPERYAESALPKAETGVIGNVRAATEVEAADVGGHVSNRVMLRLKMPF